LLKESDASATASEEPGVERDILELEERFASLRPEVLETLSRHGHGAYAFALAEQYRDFRTLAALCNKGIVYPPSENPNAQRIQGYIEKFRDEWTTELYKWYIEHG
jgi:nuclear pore complex protein Nup133